MARKSVSQSVEKSTDPAQKQPQGQTDVTPQRSRVTGAVLWSLLPGAGEIHLGKWGKGLAYGGVFWGGLVGAYATGSEAALVGVGLLAQNAYFYSIYDTYRDARLEIGNRGYRHPISGHSIWRNMADPYLFRNFAHERIWVAPAMVAANLAMLKLMLRSGAFSEEEGFGSFGTGERVGIGLALGALTYVVLGPVAVGEESLFRGTIQGSLRERIGSNAAIGTTSLLFGAAHIPNVTNGPFDSLKAEDKVLLISVRFLSAALGGLGFGWIYDGTPESALGRCITAHALSNALLAASIPFLLDRIYIPPVTLRIHW